MPFSILAPLFQRFGYSISTFFALPNLERFNLKAAAIHRDSIELGWLLMSTGYGVLYAVVVLMAAVLVFERRDFV